MQVRGFNAGYKIEKYIPKLGATLRKSLASSQNEYAEAFVAGANEMLKERSRSKLLAKMKSNARSMKATKQKDKDKGIDR